MSQLLNRHAAARPLVAYTELLEEVLLDNPLALSTLSVSRDVGTIRHRCEAEGMHFCTLALPLIAKAVESGLETGQYVVPPGFRRSKVAPGLPAFLQDALLIIFDSTGVLRPEFDWSDMTWATYERTGIKDAAMLNLELAAKAVLHIRQVCYLLYKLELPYQEELVQEKVESFVALDQELADPDGPADGSDDLLDMIAYEVRRIVQDADLEHIIPRHGPGAVATGEKGERKWTFSRTYDSLTPVYPLSYFTVGGANEIADRKEWFAAMEHYETGVSKLLAVPKNALGPRLICPEELALQYIQGGQGRELADVAETASGGRINFRDQSINAQLALRSSVSRRDATLDMKDASDRVSLALVRRVFPAFQLRYIEATRAGATELPSGEVIVLRKFAPMGSSLCFPVESVVFWATAVAAIRRALPGRRQWIRSRVYTYGDDLVVPREYAHVVIEALEEVGLKVNHGKSFIHGFFRESCGTDAFVGHLVTPTRIKKPFGPAGKKTPAALIAYAKQAAQLARLGYTRASEFLYGVVEYQKGPLPYGTAECGYLCREVESDAIARGFNLRSAREGRCRVRIHSEYQQLQVRALRITAPKADSELDGWERLLRNLTMGPGDDPARVAVASGAQTIHPRWCTIG